MVKYKFVTILPFFPHACITHNADNNPCRSECDPALPTSCDTTSLSNLATTNAANGATNQQSVAEIVGSVIGCAVVVSLLYLVTVMLVVVRTHHKKHYSVNVSNIDNTHEVYNKLYCGKTLQCK